MDDFDYCKISNNLFIYALSSRKEILPSDMASISDVLFPAHDVQQSKYQVCDDHNAKKEFLAENRFQNGR